jgi:hypothetical protein
MNHQAVFETVAEHLLKQNKKSIDGVCSYRGPNGTKCAIGALIKDEVYDPYIERHMVSSPVVTAALENSGIHIESGADNFLLLRLQAVHDNYPPQAWADQLRLVAKSEYPALEIPQFLQEAP